MTYFFKKNPIVHVLKEREGGEEGKFYKRMPTNKCEI